MNNKVPLTLLLGIFVPIQRMPILVMLLSYVYQFSLCVRNYLLIAITQLAFYFLNKMIKTNVQLEKLLSLSYRTYIYRLTHPQKNTCLNCSGI